MRSSLSLLSVIFAATACGESASQSLPFDRQQLAGWWAESYSSEPVCSKDNLKTTMEISPDGKRLEMRFDRKWKTELGEKDSTGATIVSATNRSLTIQYDGETRKTESGATQTWELIMVAPQLYRWRETGWEPGKVNIVVGVRCSK